MAYVFFRGFGAWYSSEDLEHHTSSQMVTKLYRACGVFKLNSSDLITYKHTKTLPYIKTLLSCDHVDDELNNKESKPFTGLFDNEEYFYFAIDENSARFDGFTLEILPDPVTKNNPNGIEQQKHASKELVILNKAALNFWANADPEQKDTHPKNEIVKSWLINNGFSDIKATNGASIIRPDWAAKGKY